MIKGVFKLTTPPECRHTQLQSSEESGEVVFQDNYTIAVRHGPNVGPCPVDASIESIEGTGVEDPD